MFAMENEDQGKLQRRRKPRVAPHNDSSQVLNCIHPVRGIRDLMIRSGITPPDHIAHNRKAIKQQILQNKQKKDAPPSQPSSRKSSASPRPRSVAPGGKDFIAANIEGAAQPKRGSQDGSQKGMQDWKQKPGYGQIPKYLEERKMQLAIQHAQKQAELAAKLIPPGMRLMGDDERKEMLQLLEQNKEDVQLKIQALPFLIETPSQRCHRDGLLKRMAEIEEAIQLFSRPKVLVKIQDGD